MAAKKKQKVNVEIDFDVAALEKAINDAMKYMGESIHDYIYEDLSESVGKAVDKMMKSAPVQTILEEMVQEAVSRKVKK